MLAPSVLPLPFATWLETRPVDASGLGQVQGKLLPGAPSSVGMYLCYHISGSVPGSPAQRKSLRTDRTLSFGLLSFLPQTVPGSKKAPHGVLFTAWDLTHNHLRVLKERLHLSELPDGRVLGQGQGLDSWRAACKTHKQRNNSTAPCCSLFSFKLQQI